MAANFNRVILAGNLTRDPEISYSPKGTAIANLSLALNRSYTTESGEKREDVTYVEVSAFSKLAELIGQYLKKGSSCLLEGRLKLDVWQDKQTQQQRSRLGVVAETVQFLSSPQKRDSEPREQGNKPQGRESSQRKEFREQQEEWDSSEVPF